MWRVSQEKNNYVIIKLQMYVLLYKNKHIRNEVEIGKNFECYIKAILLNILSEIYQFISVMLPADMLSGIKEQYFPYIHDGEH